VKFPRSFVPTLLMIFCVLVPGDSFAFQFGVCIHLALDRSNAATVLKLVDTAGFNTVRDDFYWSSVEPARGRLQIPAKFAQLVQAFDGVKQRGGTPLLILSFGNDAYDGGGLVTTEAGIAAFARYAAFMATTFKGRVEQFEVWSEWNTGFGSKPRVNRGEAADYVRLLAATSKAIRDANPNARVVGGVTAGIDFTWINQLIAAGGLAHLDALSVHSYTLFRFRINPEGAVNGLDKLRAILERAQPGRNLPIFVTEMGFPTSTGKMGVPEVDAAKYLARFVMLARTRPWIEGVWWYDLIDDGDNPTLSEHRFGLVAQDQRVKPAFHAASDVSRLVLASKDFQAYRFADNGYAVTGTDAMSRWAVVWVLESSFLSWMDGRTEEPAAPADVAALGSSVSPLGFPKLFRFVDGEWSADLSWHDFSAARPKPPGGARVETRP
jgi:polysaccharide biosynthesis protein PslG